MILLALVVLALGIPSACAGTGKDGDDRSGFLVDEPPLEAYPGPDGSTSGADRGAGGVSLVGSLKGDPSEFNTGVSGDVAGYKNLAFVGKWYKGCPGTGVDIIDISEPSAPKKLSDTNDYPDTSMEDMQAIDIGGETSSLSTCRTAETTRTRALARVALSYTTSPTLTPRSS